MLHKILKIEFIGCFLLTILNFVYYYYEDSLPDHYFLISSQSDSLNIFSYFLTSALAFVGHYVGPWIFFPFLCFVILYSFLFVRRSSWIDVFNIFFIGPFFLGFFYLSLPLLMGKDLVLIIEKNFTEMEILLITIAFFLVSLVCVFRSKMAVVPKFFVKLYQYTIHGLKWSFRNIRFSKWNVVKDRIGLLRSDLSVKLLFKKMNFISALRKTPASEMALEQGVEKDIEFVGHSSGLQSQTEFEFDRDEAEEGEGQRQGEEVDDSEYDDEYSEKELEKEKVKTSAKNLKKTLKENAKKSLRKKSKPKLKALNFKELLNTLKGPQQPNASTLRRDDKYFAETKKRIESKLQEFKVDAHVTNVFKGPVVDTLELELGPGVRVSKVTSITEDLGLALYGVPIRVIYPLKGRTTVGVEVPRKHREIIFLDDVLNAKSFEHGKNTLPVAMGKTSLGKSFIVDLVQMPHVLVAGSTGSGKSVFINTLLISLLAKCRPEQMKLILIDPKQLELVLYQGLPHLTMPVLTEPKKVNRALLWACEEMERRYSILKEFGVRNVENFNLKLKSSDEEQIQKIESFYSTGERAEGRFHLPYIVIVVDEFADLILTKMGKEIEFNICRLAAKARASGIHLVVATQRPSVDVITGLIKANFPTRVSFRVTSSFDSRTILNSTGAEKLLGKGDMLYRHGIELNRLHSAFIDEDSIEGFVKYIARLPGDYDQRATEFLEQEEIEDEQYRVKEGSGRSYRPKQGAFFDGEQKDRDRDQAVEKLYQEALEIINEKKQASSSMLQRRLRIGYNRAAHLMDLLEERGVVGPGQGAKPRDVLVSSDNANAP